MVVSNLLNPVAKMNYDQARPRQFANTMLETREVQANIPATPTGEKRSDIAVDTAGAGKAIGGFNHNLLYCCQRRAAETAARNG
jgi:hypothetical protein